MPYALGWRGMEYPRWICGDTTPSGSRLSGWRNADRAVGGGCSGGAGNGTVEGDFLRAHRTIQEGMMSKTKQKFVARRGVAQLKPGSNSEILYWKDSLPFKSPSVTAAKAQATRLLKADENVVNLLASEYLPNYLNCDSRAGSRNGLTSMIRR